jgi:hypothetical protein
MKRLAIAIALSCALSASALAIDGEVPSGGFKAPPPDETSIPRAQGERPTSGYEEHISGTALTLIQFALSGVL